MPFFIAKCIAAATVSLPQRNRNLFPRKNRCVQFDRANESQTLTANHRREKVHLGARLRGRTATQRSKKGSEKVLEKVLGKGSQKGSEKGF